MKISSSGSNAAMLALDRKVTGSASKAPDTTAAQAATSKAAAGTSKIEGYFATKYAAPARASAQTASAQAAPDASASSTNTKSLRAQAPSDETAKDTTQQVEDAYTSKQQSMMAQFAKASYASQPPGGFLNLIG